MVVLQLEHQYFVLMLKLNQNPQHTQVNKRCCVYVLYGP